MACRTQAPGGADIIYAYLTYVSVFADYTHSIIDVKYSCDVYANCICDTVIWHTQKLRLTFRATVYT